MERKVHTSEFDFGLWAPPVETRADLWAVAPDGQHCFVKDEAVVYTRQDGDWIPRYEARQSVARAAHVA